MRFCAACLCFALLAGCSRPSTITIIDPGEQSQVSGGYDQPPTERPVDYMPVEQADPAGEYFAPAPVDVYAPSASDEGYAPAPDAVAQDTRTPSWLTRPVDLKIGAVVGDYAVLHPLRTTYVDFNNINSLIYEGLVDLDETLRPVPMLADRWSYADGEWTFTLRSGIQFHDGSLLSAADVIASYNDAIQYTDTIWYPLLNNIESITAEGESVVKVRAKSNMGYMILYAMTFPIVQRSTINSALTMGTGPYWLMRYVESDTVHIETNALWWRRPSDELSTILMLCYPETSKALAALETREIDALATRSNAASLNRTLSDRMTIDYSTTRYECVVPNHKDSVLGNVKIREALMYAIDRTSLGNTAYMGMVQESEVPVVPGSYLYDAQATRFNYSPERALQLLLDDGWADLNGDGILEKEIDGLIADLEFTLITYNEGTSPVRTEAAHVIADQLKKVGIRINVSTLKRTDVNARMGDGEYELALVSYNLSQTPHLAFMLASAGNNNHAGYESLAMDSALMDAFTATTEGDLISAMARVQTQVTTDLPIIGLFFRTGIFTSTKSLGGLFGLRESHAYRNLEVVTLD